MAKTKRGSARKPNVSPQTERIGLDACAALHPDRLSKGSQEIPFYTKSHAGYVVARFNEEVFLRLNEDGDWRISRRHELRKSYIDGLRCKLTNDMRWVDLTDADRAAIREAFANEAT